MASLAEEIKDINDARVYAESLVETIREPLLILNGDLRVVSANRSFYELFQVKKEEVEGKRVYEIGGRQWDIPKLREALETIVPKDAAFYDLEMEHDFPKIGRRIMLLNGRRIEQEGGRRRLILLAIEDITGSRTYRAMFEEKQALVETSPNIFARFNSDMELVYANQRFERILRRPREEVIGTTIYTIGMPAAQVAGLVDLMRKAAQTRTTEILQMPLNQEEYKVHAVPEYARDGRIKAYKIYAVEVSDLVRVQKELKEACAIAGKRAREAEEGRRILDAILENIPEGLVIVDAKTKRTIRVSSYVADRLGISIDQLIGIPFDEYLKKTGPVQISGEPFKGPEETPLFQTLATGKRTLSRDVMFTSAKGEKIVICLNTAPIQDEKGSVIAAISSWRDVTEQQKAETALRESEEKYRTLVERAHDGIIIVQDGIVKFANHRMAELDGSTVEQLVGTPYTDHIHPSELPRLAERYRRRMAGEKVPAIYETVLRRRNGEPAPAELNAGVIPYQGKPANMVIIRDISERKRVEEELRRKEAEFRTLSQNLPDVIARYDRQFRYLYINPAGERLFGKPREQILGMNDAELGMPRDLVEFWHAHFKKVMDTKKEHTIEFSVPGANGIQHISSRMVPEFDARGNVTSLLSISHDITILKEAERRLSEALRDVKQQASRAEEGQRILFAVMRHIKEGITVADAPDGKIRMVSEFGAKLLRRPERELVGIPAEMRPEKWGFREKDGETLPKPDELPLMRSIKKGDTVQNEEWRIRLPEGTLRTFSFSAAPILGDSNTIIGGVSAWRDITEAKKAEETLRRNEYELRTLVDNSPDLVFRLNRHMQYVYVNPAYERVTGIPREQFIGRTNQELGMPPQTAEFWKTAAYDVIENGRERSVEFDMTSFFGKRYFFARLIPEFAKSGLVETILTLARDITERKKAEEHIRYISFHDTVTGLFNRAFFEEEIRRLDTGRELPVSIIMGDINNLKLSNDVWGHREGDRLLKTIARAIQQSCRDSDIVARWGGDEFAVILPKTEFSTADGICSRIKQVAAESRGTAVRPGISLGVATKEQPDQNIYQIIRSAEERMYDNKLAESKHNEEEVISSLLKQARERTPGLTTPVDQSRSLARRFGKELGLEEEQLKDLLLLVELHDIGKAVVPREILTRQKRLSPGEWELIREYPEAGFRIVRSFPDTARISNEALSQNEHWDGSGYPRGLKGKDIPYLARIFALIEAFTVMTHERTYAPAFTRENAIEELRRNAGRQFDPELVDVFVGRVLQRENAAV